MKRLTFALALLLTGTLVMPTSAQDTPTTPTLGLELVADGFAAPIGLVVPPDDTGRRFVVDEIGIVYVLGDDGAPLSTPFLDLTGRVNIDFSPARNDPRGLLSLAFHPDYAANGRFFVFYTRVEDGREQPYSHTDYLSAFTVSADDPNVADADSEQVIWQADQQTMEHAGGQLLFGPDGYLYVGLGDDFRPEETSAQLNNPFGKILRLDVNTPNGDTPYSIPADNPFVDTPDALPEIYAYGLRHPWRLSFSPEGDLLISDPAWTFRAQRVYIGQPGANYAWGTSRERFCFDEDGATEPRERCITGDDGQTFTAPIVEYRTNVGQIITGAIAYSGSAIPELQGAIVMGEWGLNRDNVAKLLAARPNPAGETAPYLIETLTVEPPFTPGEIVVWSLGQDAEGEIYVLTMPSAVLTGEGGQVFKLVPQR